MGDTHPQQPAGQDVSATDNVVGRAYERSLGLRITRPSWFLVIARHRDGGGIITLMLTEMLGMSTSDEQDKVLHDRSQQAIDLILSSQKKEKPVNARGGWRYTPNARDADLSVSVWQLMALRSAKNDGLQVPAAAIHDAVNYLKRSYSSPLDRNGLPSDKAGGFCYEPGRRNATFTTTAAGLLAMQVCGEYESPLVAGAADWLLEHPPKWNERFCMYGTYYYAQGMYQKGGEHAQTAARLVQEMLLEKQASDGSWQAENGEERNAGNVYSTSLAVLSLSVKYHYLPIYRVFSAGVQSAYLVASDASRTAVGCWRGAHYWRKPLGAARGGAQSSSSMPSPNFSAASSRSQRSKS